MARACCATRLVDFGFTLNVGKPTPFRAVSGPQNIGSGGFFLRRLGFAHITPG